MLHSTTTISQTVVTAIPNSTCNRYSQQQQQQLLRLVICPVTISVFYALPVMQLVLTYQTTIQVTGNEDICYYNWRCAYRLGSGNFRPFFHSNSVDRIDR